MYTGYHHTISDSEDDNVSLKNNNEKKLNLYKGNDRKYKKSLSRNNKNDSSYDESYETKRKRIEEIGSKFRSDREKYRIKSNKKIEKKKVLNFLSLDAEEEDINKRWQHSKYKEYEENDEINRKKYKEKHYLYCGKACSCRIYKNCSLFKKIYKKIKKKKNKRKKKLRSPSTTSSSSSNYSKSSSLSTSSLIKIRERLLKNLKLKNSNNKKRKIAKNSNLSIHKLINNCKTSLNENLNQKINSKLTKKNPKINCLESSESQDDVLFITSNIPPKNTSLSKNKIKFNLNNNLTNFSTNNNTQSGDNAANYTKNKQNSENIVTELNSPKVNNEFVAGNNKSLNTGVELEKNNKDCNGDYDDNSSNSTPKTIEKVTKSPPQPSLTSIQLPPQVQPSKSSQTIPFTDLPSTPPPPPPPSPPLVSPKPTRLLKSSSTQTSLTTQQSATFLHSSKNVSTDNIKRNETSAESSSNNETNENIDSNKYTAETKSSADQTTVISNNDDVTLTSVPSTGRNEEEIIIDDNKNESVDLSKKDNVKHGVSEPVKKSIKANKVSMNIKKTPFVRMANGFAADDPDDEDDGDQKCSKNKLLSRFLDEQQNKSLNISEQKNINEAGGKKNLHLRKKISSVSDSDESSSSKSSKSKSSRSSTKSSRFSRSRSNSSSSSYNSIKSGYRSLSIYSSSTTSSIESMRKRLYRGKKEEYQYDRKRSYSRSRSGYSSNSSQSSRSRSRTSSSCSSCSSYRKSKRKYKVRRSHSNSKCRKK